MFVGKGGGRGGGVTRCLPARRTPSYPMFASFQPVVLAVGCFGAFAIFSGDLDPEKAFFALSLFNLLFWPVMLFPRSLSSVIEANVSLKRLESFLLAEEGDFTHAPVDTASAFESEDSGTILRGSAAAPPASRAI